MNELAMNLATGRVYNQYFKVLIVGKALIEKMLCEDAGRVVHGYSTPTQQSVEFKRLSL